MGEGFKWFVANHSGGFLSRERMKRYKALPAIKGVGMLPIYQEKKKNSNDTQGTGHLDESQESNQTKGNESKIQRGQAIMCMLTADAFKNSNGEDFLAYVDCDKSKGIIFGLPKAFKKGTQVKAMVNSIKENGFRGTYQK